MHNFKGLIHNDKPTESCYSIVDFPLNLRSILAPLSLLFWFWIPQLWCFGFFLLQQPNFSSNGKMSFSKEKSDEPIIVYFLKNKQQINKASN